MIKLSQINFIPSKRFSFLFSLKNLLHKKYEKPSIKIRIFVNFLLRDILRNKISAIDTYITCSKSNISRNNKKSLNIFFRGILGRRGIFIRDYIRQLSK